MAICRKRDSGVFLATGFECGKNSQNICNFLTQISNLPVRIPSTLIQLLPGGRDIPELPSRPLWKKVASPDRFHSIRAFHSGKEVMEEVEDAFVSAL